MKRQYILNIALCLILLIFIAGCSQAQKNPVAENTEEVTDTGILSVKSNPSQAQVYINDELKGDTPLELYNFPVGIYKVAIKKDGYSDFEESATVKVGMRDEVETELIHKSILSAPAQALLENKSTANEMPQSASSPPQKLNVVNMSKSFIIYYDFKKSLFTDITSGNPDVFSSNYGTYVYFTAMAPSTMRIVNKQVKDVSKNDCANAGETIANLYSGQTLCVRIKEGLTAAIGGSWKDTPSELEWVLFS